MKKVLRIALCAVLALTMLLGFTGCQEFDTTTSYTATSIGIVHKKYIGEVLTITDGAGGLKKIQFDEIFTPDDWKGAKLADVTNGVATTYSPNKHVFNYLKVGDKAFKLVVSADGATVKYEEINNGAIKDLQVYVLENDANIKWYYDCAVNYQCATLKVDNSAATDKVLFTDGTDKLVQNAKASYSGVFSLRKRYSSYWDISSGSVSTGLGWRGNIEAMENYLYTYGFDYDETQATKDGSFFVLNGIKTGATLTDFKDYMKLAKTSYNEAMAKAK